jgi:hypothetical protein
VSAQHRWEALQPLHDVVAADDADVLRLVGNLEISATDNDDDRVDPHVERTGGAEATRRLLSLRNGGVEIVPRLTSNAVHVARHPHRLLWVVFGVEGENPGRPHHDVIDVAPTLRDDNAMNHVPPSIFGEARIQHATHDLFAVGSDVARLGFFPETSSSLVELVGLGP